MTEQEWLQATDPQPMLKFLHGKASERKLRLFAVTCCRRVWPLLRDERSRWVAEMVEQYADGLATRKELVACQTPARSAIQAARVFGRNNKEAARAVVRAATVSPRRAASGAACGAVNAARLTAMMTLPPLLDTYDCNTLMEARCTWGLSVYAAADAESDAQSSILRDLIGSLPFRPVSLAPAWLTWNDGLLVSMARQMYDSRDFTDIPVMADALEDAGCSDQDILGQCRWAGPHVRGYWVVDTVLGNI